MKNILFYFLLIVLLLSMTSCNNTSNVNNANEVINESFVFENEGYELNAVYSYVNDTQSHPAVLLISGSGPCDYNESIGVLAPFEDIALGLAKNGINSLRIDKRTLNYASSLGNEIGIEEEYINDCNAAIDYLLDQGNTEIYLLGHSLGGQMATKLAVTNKNIKGIILFNSSARHLADIACDQYLTTDPANKNDYISYAKAAKNASNLNSKDYYYFGANDYYWASYNELDVIKNIQDANIKTLIINSTFDRQLFDEDIEIWKANFSDNENVSIIIFDDISHFGYKIDTNDKASINTKTDFPDELIDTFSGFIKE